MLTKNDICWCVIQQPKTFALLGQRLLPCLRPYGGVLKDGILNYTRSVTISGPYEHSVSPLLKKGLYHKRCSQNEMKCPLEPIITSVANSRVLKLNVSMEDELVSSKTIGKIHSCTVLD